MTKNKKPINVIFAPGAFDQFDGTQEELDEMLKEIQDLANSGELFELAEPVDIDELMEEDSETLDTILNQLSEVEDTPKRKLH